MKEITAFAEYTMVKTGDSFIFSVKEGEFYSAVKIDHLSELGAELFFNDIKGLDIRACHLLEVAEDRAQEAITEILTELL